VAKAMLAQGQMTVAEAALTVGYESASGFSTVFSRETGQSPSEFIGAQRGAA
jgi:AraC-like DNA-binding protein